MATDEFLLNDNWKLYFHDPCSKEWDKESNIDIATISTIDDFWVIFENIKDKLHLGMFFLMREHIFPIWDDEHNVNGSFMSLKILKTSLKETSEKILIHLVNETLLKEPYYHNWESINGISFSPKKHFCIVKIWIKDKTMQDRECFNISDVYHGDILFKNNQY